MVNSFNRYASTPEPSYPSNVPEPRSKKKAPVPEGDKAERDASELTDKTLAGAAQTFVRSMLQERADVRRAIEEAKERMRRGARITKHRFTL
jgi:hypothetical protein